MDRPLYGDLNEDFWARRPLVGMVHLLALPGSPQNQGTGMKAILDQAVMDAQSLHAGGVDAVMVENFFDAPFAKDQVPPHTIAAMSSAVQAVRAAVPLPVGVNVLRNDACAALAIAHICGARFIRINVYVGAAVTDQGIIEGAARKAVLYRRELGANVAIWADVFVKHATPLGSSTLQDDTRDAIERGLADALIVTGSATGAPVDPNCLRQVKEVAPSTPILVGSGLTTANASSLLALAHGAIVGSSLKKDGIISNPVDVEKVCELRERVKRNE